MTKSQDKRISIKQFMNLFENDKVSMLLSTLACIITHQKFKNEIILILLLYKKCTDKKSPKTSISILCPCNYFVFSDSFKRNSSLLCGPVDELCILKDSVVVA